MVIKSPVTEKQEHFKSSLGNQTSRRHSFSSSVFYFSTSSSTFVHTGCGSWISRGKEKATLDPSTISVISDGNIIDITKTHPSYSRFELETKIRLYMFPNSQNLDSPLGKEINPEILIYQFYHLWQDDILSCDC